MKTNSNPCLSCGNSAVLISVPHAGTLVPSELLEKFSAAARGLPDTDWFVDRLYQWAPEMGAGMLVAPHSRYVVDLNRPADNAPLYDRSVTSLLTGLVPGTSFSGAPVYQPGGEPDAQEISDRTLQYWKPYHQCLRDELTRLQNLHGYAILLDAHSIRSQVPLLFDGRLADLNLGSNNGRSAAPSLIASVRTALTDANYSLVVDGRFKGGYITRHYGEPGKGIHALQLEMAQSVYMCEEYCSWNDGLAQRSTAVLKRLIQALIQWTPGND